MKKMKNRKRQRKTIEEGRGRKRKEDTNLLYSLSKVFPQKVVQTIDFQLVKITLEFTFNRCI
jgi:hypothetical protein